MKSVFSIDLLFLDDTRHFIEQRAIFQNQQMRVKNAAFLGAHFLTHLFLYFQNLLARLHECLLQTIDFFGQASLRNRLPGNDRVTWSQHEDFAPAHAARDRDAAEKLFSLGQCLWHG